LVIIDSLALGGAERLLTAFVAAAPAAGLDVSVAVVSGPDDRRVEMLPALRRLDVEPTFLNVPRLLSPGAVPAAVRAIRGSGCDVVHAHLEYAATLGAVAGWITRRPVVSTFHHVPRSGTGWRNEVREWLAVALTSRSARTVFVSKASRHSFRARYHRLPDRNWVVIPNGIDVHAFSPAEGAFPADLAIPAGVPVVLLPAVLRGSKGHEVALAAWRAVRAVYPGARLLFAGSGPEEGTLRRLAAAYGVSASVIFAGFRADVVDLMRASQLVLLPSRTEALPTVLMEAAACGRAVVASNVEGIPEVVVDGVTGKLIDPDDAAGLAAAILELLGDDERRASMGRAARVLAEREFSLERWTGSLRAIYEDALGE
jgi:glycosyltransferase involved in cell wall biosynthesis